MLKDIALESVKKLMTQAEIDKLFDDQSVMKREDPSLFYDVIGCVGKCKFKVKRKSDNEQLLMILSDLTARNAYTRFTKEVIILNYLKECENIHQILDVYVYKSRIWLFTDYFEGTKMTTIC